MTTALIGNLSDTSAAEALHPLLAKAFEFLRTNDIATLAPGKYPIDGEWVYASVSDSALKPAGDVQRVEYHRRYFDVQAPISGEETFGLPPRPAEDEGYDEARDCAFFNAACPLRTLKPGEFAVFPPEVPHAPCLTLGEGGKVRKVVVKVLA